jgi:hypothetical protein
MASAESVDDSEATGLFYASTGYRTAEKKRAVARSVGTVAPVFKTWLYCEMVDGFET